jgi:hypothetical protein
MDYALGPLRWQGKIKQRRSPAMKSFLAILSFAIIATSAGAQGATITGVVRDSMSQPLAAAEVVARPGMHRTRTDSAGRFTLAGLDGGNYKVSARKFGYGPANWDVSLSKGGRIEIQLMLPTRMPMLDTVVVTAGRECPPMSLDGFMCRRKVGGGLFLDYTDIDDKEPIYTADIFRDIKGFRVDVRPGRYGPVRVPVLNNFGCISSIVDGRCVRTRRSPPTRARGVSMKRTPSCARSRNRSLESA